MAGPSATVTQPRADALARRIARLDGDTARLEAVVLGLVDALLEGDDATLAAALDALRDARARADDPALVGALDAAIGFAHAGLDRLPSRAAVAPGTQAHGFLRALAASAAPVGSAELRRVLAVDETQVSRAGRRLLEQGLVTRGKVGRDVFWRLTPRGRRALDDAPATADPTRERIIERTLELHRSQGIQATTLEQIAERAGVPVETVTELFPTHDDLVRSCGAHFVRSLQLPPRDEAVELFAGAASEHDRARRLVTTVFGIYERGADGITAARREREEVPAVGDSLDVLDGTFDALVGEALRPLHPDAAAVAAVRALTDLEIWRALRDEGATPEAAIDEGSAAVERWLADRPSA